MNTKPCGYCGGSGEVQDLEVRQHGRYRMQWARCRACDGTGRVVTPKAAAADTGTRAEIVDAPLSGLVRVGWTRDDLEVVR